MENNFIKQRRVSTASEYVNVASRLGSVNESCPGMYGKAGKIVGKAVGWDQQVLLCTAWLERINREKCSERLDVTADRSKHQKAIYFRQKAFCLVLCSTVVKTARDHRNFHLESLTFYCFSSNLATTIICLTLHRLNDDDTRWRIILDSKITPSIDCHLPTRISSRDELESNIADFFLLSILNL